MRTLGNVLWHIPFFGFVNAFIVYVMGLLLTITVIAAPIGLGLMEFGKFLLAPFSRSMVKKADVSAQQNSAWQAYSTIVMVLYLPFGIIMAVLAIFQIAGLFLSIVGIPVALVVAKSLGTYLNPVGKTCVNYAVAEEIERRKATEQVDAKLGTGNDTADPAAS